MAEQNTNLHKQRWTKIFVIGVVIVLVILLVVLLSRQVRNQSTTGDGQLTEAEKQQILAELAKYEADQEPAPELSEEEKAAILVELARYEANQEPAPELSEEEKAVILKELSQMEN